MTFDETVRQHQKMWNWIADECIRQQRKVEKAEYPFEGERPWNLCYCCDYTRQLDAVGNCVHCPIFKYNCMFGDSPYWGFVMCLPDDWQRASAFARAVAMMPERTKRDDDL